MLTVLLASCGGAATGGAAGQGDLTGEPSTEEALSGDEPAGATPAAAGATKGRVTLDPVTCDPPGQIDEAVVDAHFEGMLPKFGSCYDDVLEQDTGLDGDYTVEVALMGELGVAKCGGYTHVKAGFWIAGFQECLGDQLLNSTVGTPLDGVVKCQLVLHFAKD